MTTEQSIHDWYTWQINARIQDDNEQAVPDLVEDYRPESGRAMFWNHSDPKWPSPRR